MRVKLMPSSGFVAGMAGLLLCCWTFTAAGQSAAPFDYINSQLGLFSGLVGFGATGAVGAAASTPCASPTATSDPCVGGVAGFNSYQYQSVASGTGSVAVYSPDSNDLFQVASEGASAISTAPPSQINVASNIFQLSNITASSAVNGTTGQESVAVTGAWDTLTFGNTSSLTTATLIWNLNLAHTVNPISGTPLTGDYGYGGGCIGIASGSGSAFCNPFTATTTSLQLNPTMLKQPTVLSGQIMITGVPLNEPLLLYMSVYSVSEIDFNLQNALIDPALTLELPAGVTVTSASGLIGGLTAPVPLPDSLALLTSGASMLMLMGFRRRRALV